MKMKCLCRNFPLVVMLIVCANGTSQICDIYSAKITLTYQDPTSGQDTELEITGRFGVNSPLASEGGQLVHVLTEDAMNHGCTPATNAPTKGTSWVALIQRGGCKFGHKISMTTQGQGSSNASAVIIYNHEDEDTLITMDGKIVDQVPSVFIHKHDGDALAALVDSGVAMSVNISEGAVLTTLRIHEDGSVSLLPGSAGAEAGEPETLTPVKNVQLLIICLSFVALLSIGLVCLLVYAVKRNKYMQAKNRARNPIFMVDLNREAKETRTSLLNAFAHAHHAGSVPPHAGGVPPHAGSVPPHAGSAPPHAGSVPPHAGVQHVALKPSPQQQQQQPSHIPLQQQQIDV